MSSSGYQLVSQAIGGLPIIDAVMDRLGLPAALDQALPPRDRRVKLPRPSRSVWW